MCQGICTLYRRYTACILNYLISYTQVQRTVQANYSELYRQIIASFTGKLQRAVQANYIELYRQITSSCTGKLQRAVQANYWPRGFQEVEAPRFQNNRHMKFVSPTHRPSLPARKYSW